ncbi:MAG: hypothetical protein KF708_07960 [Pirellulales bacterium]|nr:hypothetical protein [Pirellulales bacterium]
MFPRHNTNDIEFNTNNSKISVINFTLDRSGSMNVSPHQGEVSKADLAQIGLGHLKTCLSSDAFGGSNTYIGLNLFNESVSQSDYMPASQWEPPLIQPAGRTHLGEAIESSLDSLEKFLWEQNQQGRTSNRPVLAIMSDGLANGEEAALAASLERLRTVANPSRPMLTLIVAAGDSESLASLSGIGFPTAPVLVQSVADWKRLVKFISVSATSGR